MGYLDSEGLETQIQYIKGYVRQHGGIPVGFEYFSPNPNIPQGSLPLFGGEYSRATYSALWDWVQEQTGYLKTESEWQDLSTAQNGNVPFYSDGDGSTTFRVPSLKCWIKGANGTVTEVGSFLEAGLPNIYGGVQVKNYETSTGSFTSMLSNADGSLSLTLYSAGTYGGKFSGNTQVGSQKLFLNASSYNAIYGNSTTVQPESIVGMWLVKAYGTIVDTGTIDEQQYIDDRMAAEVTRTDGKFLPLAGGTMTGNIVLSSGVMVSNYNNTTAMRFVGGDATNGYTGKPRIALFGNNYSTSSLAGVFALVADDSTDSCILNGYPNGDLKWNSKEVERVNASGSDYIRYESGLQICWGSAQTTTSGHTYTFPVSFNTSPKIAFSVGNTTESNVSYSTKITGLSKTGFKGICSSTSNSGQNITCTYIAIGKWK